MTSTTSPDECPIVELRRYTLHPGRRDALVELFEREFIETQEARGIRVLGQFRELDEPHRFIWLRGFASMSERAAALPAFYGSEVWARHRDAANATMIDSDDVFLLQPAWPGAGLPHTPGRRAAPGQGATLPPGLVDATVFPLAGPPDAPPDPQLLALVRGPMTQCLRAGGARAIGWYLTHPGPNNYPRLPVRQGEQVLAGVALFDDAQAFQRFADSGTWARDVSPLLRPFLQGAVQTMRLAPTPRSAWHA